MWILRRFSKDGFSAQFLTQRFSRSFSKDFPPIFRNVEVWLVQKFQINFSIFTHFMRNFGSMSYNGKSICEGRAKLYEKFNFYRTKQIAFSDYQITKKSNMKSKLRLNASGSSIIYSTPPFANTMLCDVFLFFKIFCNIISVNYQNKAKNQI